MFPLIDNAGLSESRGKQNHCGSELGLGRIRTKSDLQPVETFEATGLFVSKLTPTGFTV
jgi:hypothetical protein